MPDNLRSIDASIVRSQTSRNPRRRFIDICVQFEIFDGEHAGWKSLPYGGRWDRDRAEFCSIWDAGKNGWTGEMVTPHIVKVAQQSIEAIQDWQHMVQLILGGRRSGKTTGTLAPKIMALMVVFVGLPGCVLSPTYRQSMNVWRALSKHVPRGWWAERNKTDRRMKLVTGAEVVLLSADRDDSSRSEGCAWQVNDERQDISEAAAANAELSASEASGPGAHIIIETATIKAELREHYDKVVRSSRGIAYFMDSYGNPFIDHGFLDDAKEFLDQEMIDREIHARWPELSGRVYHPYNEDIHKRNYPTFGWVDITAAFCREKIGSAYASCEYVLGVDPPGHALIAKIGRDETLHVLGEVVIGADGASGDIRDLARLCRGRVGNAQAVAIQDPHESHWHNDVLKYFRGSGFRFAACPPVLIEYRITAVRSRIEKGKLLVDSSCVHLRESLRDQTYDQITHKPDNRTPSKITKMWTLDHPPDSLGYLVTKFWPAKYPYELREKAS